jgi:hypothetical protein
MIASKTWTTVSTKITAAKLFEVSETLLRIERGYTPERIILERIPPIFEKLHQAAGLPFLQELVEVVYASPEVLEI